MSKIGVGICTIQTRDINANHLNLISQPTEFHIHYDKERKGVAKSRNIALKTLYDSGCDYFFLFDDDTYPIKPGWQDHIIDVAKRRNIGVLTYMIPNATILDDDGEVRNFQWGIGCFNFMTRHAIQTIGYFNTEYEKYGYEDIAYLYRARTARLTPRTDADCSLSTLSDYILCEDHVPTDRVPDKPGGFTQAEKNHYANINTPIFQKEVGSGQLYYPFS